MRRPVIKSPRELALTLRQLAQAVDGIRSTNLVRADLEAAAALLEQMHETPLPDALEPDSGAFR